MKTRRILLSVFAFLFLIAGLYSGEKIFYVGFSIILSLFIYAAATSLWILLDFKYLQTVTPPFTSKGQRVSLNIQIHNDKPFIMPYIKVYYALPSSIVAGSTMETLLSILPFRYGEIKEEFICDIRGNYTIGIKGVEVMDFFGLFTFRINIEDKSYHTPLRLIVYPRIIPLNTFPLPEIQSDGTILHQNQQLVKTTNISSLSDVRQFHYGDTLKKIHWKTSSKLQELYVKNFETNTQPSIKLIMDTTPCGDTQLNGLQTEDQIVECSTAVSNYILSKWMPLSLIVYHKERFIIDGNNPSDFNTFYEFFTNISFDGLFSVKEVLSLEVAGLSHGGNIILILHDISYELFNMICIIQSSGINCLVILVKHRNSPMEEALKITNSLYENGILTLVIFHDQRLDIILEEIL